MQEGMQCADIGLTRGCKRPAALRRTQSHSQQEPEGLDVSRKCEVAACWSGRMSADAWSRQRQGDDVVGAVHRARGS